MSHDMASRTLKIRAKKMVHPTGIFRIEDAEPCRMTWRNGTKNQGKKNGAPDRIRTYDLLLRRQSLYPAELRVHISLQSFTISRRSIFSTGQVQKN